MENATKQIDRNLEKIKQKVHDVAEKTWPSLGQLRGGSRKRKQNLWRVPVLKAVIRCLYPTNDISNSTNSFKYLDVKSFCRDFI